MMWKAFSQRYMVASSPAAHALEHLLDMRDRRLRQDAVAEIEDEWAARQRRQDVVDVAVERRAAGEQRQRIEIALHRHARLELLARERAVDRPVEADRVDAGSLDIAAAPSCRRRAESR